MALTKVGKEGITGISNSSDATAITINSSENIGIGTGTGSIDSKLHVHGSFRQTGATAPFEWTVNAGAADTYKLNAVGFFDNLLVATSTGKVGIGTNSPPDDLSVVASGANAQLSVDRSDGASGRTVLIHSSTGGQLQTTGSVPLIFGTADTERMRLDTSGRLLINRTSASTVNPHSKLHVKADSSVSAVTLQVATNGFEGIAFLNANNSNVGSITVGSASTAFNTSSDYRLKENIVDMTGAIDRVKALAPKRFNFIADADTTVDGFLAHEAQTVVPEAVTGTKDKVDDDDNPVMQGIDQSKLVPLLTGALKEAVAKIEALEARVKTLEDA